jgi:hypothetical protein
MSKLMSVLGIILLAIGLALGLLEIVKPGQVQSLGVSMDTAVTLLVGGILAIGLGGVIAALEGAVSTAPGAGDAEAVIEEAASEESAPAPAEEVAVETPDVPAPSRIRFPGFGRKAAAATTATAAEATAEATSGSVQQTIEALEKAKQDIKGAMGGMDTISEAVTEGAPVEEAEAAEGELYVIEETTIRGRPARILSDNTVEAETDDGWMRFENLEHLNEYLDAAEA